MQILFFDITELYFIIAKFLASGPFKETAKVYFEIPQILILSKVTSSFYIILGSSEWAWTS